MKAIILITAIFLSQYSQAGTGGGGVMAATEKAGNGQGNLRGGSQGGTLKLSPKLSTEIVYNIGKQNGLVKFAHGQLVDNQWQIQNIEMAEADLINDLSMNKALEDSKAVNGWVSIP